MPHSAQTTVILHLALATEGLINERMSTGKRKRSEEDNVTHADSEVKAVDPQNPAFMNEIVGTQLVFGDDRDTSRLSRILQHELSTEGSIRTISTGNRKRKKEEGGDTNTDSEVMATDPQNLAFMDGKVGHGGISTIVNNNALLKTVPNGAGTTENEEDMKTRRVMRNRQSAKESRDRRRNLLSKLTVDAKRLNAKNQKLEAENALLRAEVQELRKNQKEESNSGKEDGASSGPAYPATPEVASIPGKEKDDDSTVSETASVILPEHNGGPTGAAMLNNEGDKNGTFECKPVDIKEQRRMRRVMRNRRSAAKARAREKQLIEMLSTQVDALSAQKKEIVKVNERLRSEAQELMQQVVMALANARQSLGARTQQTQDTRAFVRTTTMGPQNHVDLQQPPAHRGGNDLMEPLRLQDYDPSSFVWNIRRQDCNQKMERTNNP